MDNDHADIRSAFGEAMRSGAPAGSLNDLVESHFPRLQAFREADDLIIMFGTARRLLVRRVGDDRFITCDVASDSASTTMLDRGGEAERDLDGLVREIAAFAES